jgi:hypothetical protein
MSIIRDGEEGRDKQRGEGFENGNLEWRQVRHAGVVATRILVGRAFLRSMPTSRTGKKRAFVWLVEMARAKKNEKRKTTTKKSGNKQSSQEMKMSFRFIW